jgi:hypothetical protein
MSEADDPVTFVVVSLSAKSPAVTIASNHYKSPMRAARHAGPVIAIMAVCRSYSDETGWQMTMQSNFHGDFIASDAKAAGAGSFQHNGTCPWCPIL